MNKQEFIYILQKTKYQQNEIDLFAGRKENNYCMRNIGIKKNKTSVIRSTENTIELRIFSSFDKCSDLLNRVKVLDRLLSVS